MAKVLHIQVSPRGDDSYSIRLARAFLAELAAHDAELTVDTLDLFSADLPEFAASAAKAKYAIMGGAEPVDEAGRAWQRVLPVIEQLTSADKVVISSPMWNFSIPYRLKHYIDLITQPGLTFRYSADTGYTGLVTGRPVALLLARGGDYSESTGLEAYDMQLPYLRSILGFIGFEHPHVIIVQPTLHGGPDTAAARLDDAIADATALARSF